MVKVKHSLIGETFGDGRLLVLEQAEDYIRPSSGRHEAMYHVRCSCGNEFDVLAYSLISGNTTSCGCYYKAMRGEYGKKNKKYNSYVIRDNYVIFYTQKNEPFLVSIEDFGKVKDICWHRTKYGYFMGHFNNKLIFLHRLITDCPDDMVVDHKEGSDYLYDNRRSNLRIVTPAENAMNMRLRKDNTSGVTGVAWSEANQKWIVQICVDGKMVYLGYYVDFNEAVAVREAAEDKYFGKHSFKNSRKM